MAVSEPSHRPPLPVELHAATHAEHAILNRTIIARLPLCLPGSTSSPALYAQGLTVVRHMYDGIEEAWDILLAQNTLSPGHRDIITQLNIPQLRRSPRLNLSLGMLEANLSEECIAHLNRLRFATRHFRQEIVEAIRAKPYLLMAYTWTMYLALFNGGRWIAKQLLGAGDLFWSQERGAAVRNSLSFWFFGDDEGYNGEDLKLAFKSAFNDLAETLTDQERDEIIAESKYVFEIFSNMVTFLDQNVVTDSAGLEATLNSTHDMEEPFHTSTTTLEYLASFTPTAILNTWRSIIHSIPFSQTNLPIPPRRDIEQHRQ